MDSATANGVSGRPWLVFPLIGHQTSRGSGIPTTLVVGYRGPGTSELRMKLPIRRRFCSATSIPFTESQDGFSGQASKDPRLAFVLRE